jgi:hypothetical protein
MYVYINTTLVRYNSDLCTATVDDYLFVLFIHRFTMENINITASGPGRFYVSVPPEST